MEKKQIIKHLFIDSNVWLSLYHFSKNDLETFIKIKDILDKDIKLYVPRQTRDEIIRNRDTKLSESFEEFKNFEFKFPNYCRDYECFDNFNKLYNNLKSIHKEWTSKISEDIKNNTMKADKCINDVFAISGLIECDNYIEKAETRYKRGNPPGKDNKYGDAINWECLLDNVPNGSDLYFVSDDKDYKSKLNPNSFNRFLEHEWMEKKQAHVYFYTNLVSFFSDHVKSIKLQDELEKSKFIKQLIDSPNFVTTHSIIEEMKKYSGWDDSQIRDICFAFVANSQVNWIIEDEDVKSFYESIVGVADDIDSLKVLIERKYDELNPESHNTEVIENIQSIE